MPAIACNTAALAFEIFTACLLPNTFVPIAECPMHAGLSGSSHFPLILPIKSYRDVILVGTQATAGRWDVFVAPHDSNQPSAFDKRLRHNLTTYSHTHALPYLATYIIPL